MVSIKGQIVHGQGHAQSNYPNVLRLLARDDSEFSEFQNYHPATLNLELDEPLHKRRADHWSKPIEWMQDRFERFGFTKVRVEFPPTPAQYKAIIIAPEGGYLTYDPLAAEVIVEAIVRNKGSLCRVHIDHIPIVDAPKDLESVTAFASSAQEIFPCGGAPSRNIHERETSPPRACPCLFAQSSAEGIFMPDQPSGRCQGRQPTCCIRRRFEPQEARQRDPTTIGRLQ